MLAGLSQAEMLARYHHQYWTADACAQARQILTKESSMPQLYELRIIADGEVRDADGNLKDSEPLTATVTVTKEQLRALLAAQQPTDTTDTTEE